MQLLTYLRVMRNNIKRTTINLQNQEYPILLFDNVTVKFVSQHKHLGLTFSENMKWKCHIDSILNSASRMIGIMRKLKYIY